MIFHKSACSPIHAAFLSRRALQIITRIRRMLFWSNWLLLLRHARRRTSNFDSVGLYGKRQFQAIYSLFGFLTEEEFSVKQSTKKIYLFLHLCQFSCTDCAQIVVCELRPNLRFSCNSNIFGN